MAITRVGEATTKIAGTGTGTAITTALPSGIASGDLLILEVATGLGPYDLTDPAGWTPLRRVGDVGSAPNEAALEVWWKFAGSSNTAPTLTAATATRWLAVIRAFRGVDASAPFLSEDAAEESGGSSTTTHTAPTLSNTVAGAWGLFSLVSRQVHSPYTATPGPGLTERSDQDTGNTGSSNNTLHFVADSNGPVAPGSVTYSATASGGSAIAVMWAALLRPAGSGATIAGATAIVTAQAEGGTATGGVGGPVTVAGVTAVVVAQGGVRPIPPEPPAADPTWPPDPYRRVIRSGGYALTYTVDASVGGVPVAGATGLQPVGGSITDTTKPGVRRKLDLDLAAEPGLYDLLSPIGTTLTVTAHITYLNRTVQDIPMGVFDVDVEKFSESGGRLSLTAPDKWVKIQRARFVRPAASTPGRLVVDQIAELIKGALGAGETVAVSATSTARVGALTWEKDRDKAILDLAKGIGAWVYFDRNGLATIADVPTIGASADWLIDASANGVLIDLDRERSRTDTHNVVVVSSSAVDNPFPTQVVWDNDEVSPTYAGPDPVNRPDLAGTFGVVPFFHDTPLPLDAVGALRAGQTILVRKVGLASQVSLGSAPNPALDAFDVLDVMPPRERYDMPRVLERHVADTVTHPLTVGAQQIEGRSTRTEEFA